jgi:hypothetical protein
MALVPLFGHGFDNLDTADIPVVFTQEFGGGHAIVTSGGRNGGRYYQTTNVNTRISRPVSIAVDTYAFGCGVRAVSGTGPMFALNDNATNQINIYLRSDRRLEIRQGGQAGSVIAGPGTALISDTVWKHIAVWAKIADSGGRVVVKIDGVVDLDTGAGGVDTKASANAYATKLIFGGTSEDNSNSARDFQCDDLWIATAAGTSAGDGYGDLNFEALVPNGAGASAQFTPSTGANWQNLDDIPQDGDGTYNYSNTIGHKDTVAMTNLVATTGNIPFLMIETFDRKEDAGSAAMRHVLRMSATESESADFAPTQSAAYAHHGSCYDTKPGGGAITIADVNAMENGYKYQS